MSKKNSIFFWTTSLNLFPQFERRHCCLSSPDGQPRSLAGPVCVREPLCLLERSPPFSILVWQSLFYFCLDQVYFFLIFMLPIYSCFLLFHIQTVASSLSSMGSYWLNYFISHFYSRPILVLVFIFTRRLIWPLIS